MGTAITGRMAADTPVFRWPEGKQAALSLSFDDARESQVDAGFPILNRHGVKATFYVSFGPLERRLEEWRRAVAEGHEIGNHSLTHPCSGNFQFARKNALEDYTLERIEEDVVAASEKIESLLRVKARTFAYPCGQTFVGRGVGLHSYVPVVARHFLAGRGAFNEGPNDPAFCDLAQAFAMDMDGASFARLKELIDQTASRGGWLILLAHDVSSNPRQAVHPDVLDALCRYCAAPARGVWCDTVANVARYVSEQQKRCASLV